MTTTAIKKQVDNYLPLLSTKQQALILGHAVPMPVVIKTRAYDEKFYGEIGDTDWSTVEQGQLLVAAAAAKTDLGF